MQHQVTFPRPQFASFCTQLTKYQLQISLVTYLASSALLLVSTYFLSFCDQRKCWIFSTFSTWTIQRALYMFTFMSTRMRWHVLEYFLNRTKLSSSPTVETDKYNLKDYLLNNITNSFALPPRISCRLGDLPKRGPCRTATDTPPQLARDGWPHRWPPIWRIAEGWRSWPKRPQKHPGGLTVYFSSYKVRLGQWLYG